MATSKIFSVSSWTTRPSQAKSCAFGKALTRGITTVQIDTFIVGATISFQAQSFTSCVGRTGLVQCCWRGLSTAVQEHSIFGWATIAREFERRACPIGRTSNLLFAAI